MTTREPGPVLGAAVAQNEQAVVTLKALLAAWQAAAIYEENNNAYQARRRDLKRALDDIFKHTDVCRVVYRNGYFFFNGERLNYDREFSFGRALAFRFGGLGLGELSIEANAAPDSVDHALFALAQTDTRRGNGYDALRQTWDSLNIHGVTIGALVETEATPQERDDPAQREARRRRRAYALFQRAETVVQDMWERVRDRNSFDGPATQRVVHQLVDQIAHDEPALLEFASLRDFDEYTYYHSVNVGIYSIAVGMRLGLGRHRLTQLGMAALFHDIGKVKLPRDLITKPDEFDDDDWAQIKRHPVLGALTLASLKHIDADTGPAMAGAYEHHLRLDGSGYPTLSGPRTLHLYSRIIAMCDAFDAMTSGRVYQKTHISPDEALRRLVHKGRVWYDPIVVKALVHVLGIFPVGTLVRLSDESICVIIRNNADDLYAPDGLVVRDAEGLPVRHVVRLCGYESHRPDAGPHIMAILNPEEESIQVSDYIGLNYHVQEDVEID